MLEKVAVAVRVEGKGDTVEEALEEGLEENVKVVVFFTGTDNVAEAGCARDSDFAVDGEEGVEDRVGEEGEECSCGPGESAGHGGVGRGRWSRSEVG